MKKKTILRKPLAIIGLVLLLALFCLGAVAGWNARTESRRPLILEVDFDEAMPEKTDALLAAAGMPEPLSLRAAIETIDGAARDPRVKVLVGRICSPRKSLAHVQELRDAVTRFRAAGKKAIVYSETFGEVGPSNSGYYLATAFDEIYLQPSGDLGLTGLYAETQFFRGTLDKLAITPRGGQRHEYKNALNPYIEKEFTPAHRESMQAIVDVQFDQMLRGIAERRRIPRPELETLVNNAPYVARAALDARLVDGLLYRDEVYANARQIAGEKAELLYLARYRKKIDAPYTEGSKIAVITGAGIVQRGDSQSNFLTGDHLMGSDTVAAAFRAAGDDPQVKAIIFRVDCPGGSYVASDTILREASLARAKGKPLIVTMGSAAASGGYFVALNADRIIAQPGTLTGSIGVLRVKLLTREFWNKLGVSYNEVETAQNASMWSGLADFSPEQQGKFDEWLDRIYVDFTQKVASGRGLPLERVQEIAKGRVWLGETALQLGLVDELGGWHESIAAARKLAGLKPDAPVKLVEFPKEKGLIARLLQKPKNSEHATAQMIAAIRPIIGIAKQLGIFGPQPSVIQMPDFAVSP